MAELAAQIPETATVNAGRAMLSSGTEFASPSTVDKGRVMMTSDIRVENEAFRHKRTETATLKTRVGRLLKRYAPLPFYLLSYSRSSSKIRSAVSRERLFADFLAQSSGPCLQIAVKSEIGRKFGDNWISVDRYDHSAVIDRHDDIHSLGFPDAHFNAVVCWS
ncbi:MAG TPA: hypothetical protein VGL98_01445, partial [Gammaproteobacteria bacterium]